MNIVVVQLVVHNVKINFIKMVKNVNHMMYNHFVHYILIQLKINVHNVKQIIFYLQ